ncbi:MAG: hypothetical protein ACRC78_21645 [Planktothrix sp.]
MPTAQEISYGGTAGVGGNAGLAQIIPDRESVYLKYPGMILSDKMRKTQLQAEKIKASKPIEEIKLVPLDETLIESKQIQKAKDYYGFLNQAERQGLAHSLNPELQEKRRETELSLNTLKNLNAQVKDLKNGEFKYYDKNRLINEYIPSQLGEYLKDDKNINEGKQFDPKIANATTLFKKQFFLSDFANTIKGVEQEIMKTTGNTQDNIFGIYTKNNDKGEAIGFRFMKKRENPDGTTYKNPTTGKEEWMPGISKDLVDNLMKDPTYTPHLEANTNERLDDLIRSINQNPKDNRMTLPLIDLKEGDNESRTLVANNLLGGNGGIDAYKRRIAESDLDVFQSGSTKDVDRTVIDNQVKDYFGFGSSKEYNNATIRDKRIRLLQDGNESELTNLVGGQIKVGDQEATITNVRWVTDGNKKRAQITYTKKNHYFEKGGKEPAEQTGTKTLSLDNADDVYTINEVYNTKEGEDKVGGDDLARLRDAQKSEIQRSEGKNTGKAEDKLQPNADKKGRYNPTPNTTNKPKAGI